VEVRVELVDVTRTHPLRQQVLRPHQRVDEVAVPGELGPDAVGVAAITPEGEVVGTAVVVRERCPFFPGREPAWRLRAMATVERLRGRGVGGRIVRHAIGYVALHGGGLLWCHARIPARPFYERAGFRAIGEEWLDPYTGPHITMWRDVEPPED
jgi:GNAT superfamily N-acetyltransferase